MQSVNTVKIQLLNKLIRLFIPKRKLNNNLTVHSSTLICNYNGAGLDDCPNLSR